MPDLLVTLCNLAEPRPTALLRIDIETGSTTPVQLGATVPIKSCTGLARDGSRIYVLCADADVRTYLAVLEQAELAPIYFQLLPEIIDGHSICVHDGRLYVVSTGNDAIFSYELVDTAVAQPTLVWNIPDHSGTHHDTHHLNSIAVRDGEVLFTAFGAKQGQTWSTATSGYVFSVTRGEVIISDVYQPHSLKERDGRLFYCESARGNLSSGEDTVLEIGEYTRGLEFLPGGVVAIGSSVGRKISKSTGIINNPGDPGAKSGSCKVSLHALRPDSTTVELRNLDLSGYGSEIYDLLSLSDITSEPDARDSAIATDQKTGHASDANALTKHQMRSELDREQEQKETELQALSDALARARGEYAGYETKIALQKAESATLDSEIEKKSLELARLKEAVERLTGASSHPSAAEAARSDPAPRWMARFLGKQDKS